MKTSKITKFRKIPRTPDVSHEPTSLEYREWRDELLK